MEKIKLSEKNKNKILNIGIIVLALYLAFQIYKSLDNQANFLLLQKDNELKKNIAIEDIVAFEKKIDGYKRVLIKKDLGSVMEAISAIARSCSVKIISIKPGNEEKFSTYVKTSFSLVVSAPNYHSLGDFISQVENDKDIYIIDDININLVKNARPQEEVKTILNVDLKISTISYL